MCQALTGTSVVGLFRAPRRGPRGDGQRHLPTDTELFQHLNICFGPADEYSEYQQKTGISMPTQRAVVKIR